MGLCERYGVWYSCSFLWLYIQVAFHHTYSAEERKLVKRKTALDLTNEATLSEIVELATKLKTEQQGK